jgi:hypothetical protein
MKTISLKLAKHPHERRYLMCWYEINYSKSKVQFRSDYFVTEADEEKLHKLHCTIGSVKELTEKCTEILSPYANIIMEEVQRFLFLGAVDQIKIKHLQLISKTRY